MLLIVLAVLAGIGWFLFASKQKSEAAAKAFVQEAATRLAFQFDRKFLDVHLASDAQTRYPPSFRERFFDRLRALGVPAGPVEVEGKVHFTSYFFQPAGQLRARLNYSAAPAYIDFHVSHPNAWWQINNLNLTWTRPEQDLGPFVPQSLGPPPENGD